MERLRSDADENSTGTSPHHSEYPKWPKSTNYARRAARDLRHRMDYHFDVHLSSPSYHTSTRDRLTIFSNIMTNEQKKDWFLRLNPNGRIPVIIDNTQSPPFPVMETSAELLYLLKFADKNDVFGFKDELERNQALQWLFFWHGSGAPYQGQMNHFGKFAKEKIPCMPTTPSHTCSTQGH